MKKLLLMPHYLRWLRSHRVNTMMMTFGTAFTDWKTVSQNWRNSASR